MTRPEQYRSKEAKRNSKRRMAQTTLERLRQRKQRAEEELKKLGDSGEGHQRASIHDNPALEERRNMLRGIMADVGNLNRVTVIRPRRRTGRVGVGNRVTIEFNGGNRETYTVLSNDDAAYSGRPDVISYKSPIGSAVLGKRPGETTTADLPDKRRIKVKVHRIEPGDF